jgi:CheY-like chemotaxis protein
MAEKQRILVVDDNKENIQILNEVLGSDYSVCFATNGPEALELVLGPDPPDLILLDVMMPGMDGYEVCRRLQENKSASKMPIIFVTVLSEAEEETRGFAAGAVDFIVKPFNPAIVRARVKTHLALRTAQLDLLELAEKTLSGSIQVLVDMLAISSSVVFSRANRLKSYMSSIVQFLELKNPWQYELAAQLSQIGCITIPDDVLMRIFADAVVTEEEKKQYLAHPETGRELLQKIPRLEIVAEIIGRQHDPLPEKITFKKINEIDPVTLGLTLLKAVITFDQLTSNGLSRKRSLQEMSCRKLVSPDVIGILKKCIKYDKPEKVSKEIQATQLVESMVIDEDIYNDKGVLLIKKGSEATLSVIRVLQRYTELEKIKGSIRVLVDTSLS